MGLSEKLLAEINRQFDAPGSIAKRGGLVDAPVISVAAKRPALEDGWVNPRHFDGSFTVKNGETFFGYKTHLAVDEESDVVWFAEMTSTDLHDNQRGEALIQGDEKAYYADTAHDSRARQNDRLNE